MKMYLLEAIQSRLDIGKQRYGHGVLVAENINKNWKRELLEEMLDGVVYAAANVLRTRDHDDDDNTAIQGLIRYRLDASATIADDDDTQLLDLVLFAADAVFKLVKNDLDEPQLTTVTSLPDP
jgi:hypothetical protein